MTATIFRCPEDRQALHEADERIVANLEAKRASGDLRNHSGESSDQPIEAGLLRADGRRFYPVRGGIPILLIEESFTIAGASGD